ncbi:MAG: hypothetical protein IKY79_09030 [Bacteroidales bacterium]|nr:hypothetical protein [Bacteroidales bacterium]
MVYKKQSEEIQSRRDFFKKSTKNQKVMRNSLSKLTIMAIACLFTSCMSYVPTTSYVSMEEDYAKAFVGSHHNVIVSSLGAPDRQTSDGAGGTILIYEKITTTSNSNSNSIATAYNVNYYSKTYTPGAQTNTNTVTTQNTSYIHVFIGADGVCYGVKTNHQKKVIDEEAVEWNKKAQKKNVKIALWSYLGVMGAAAIVGALFGGY